MRVVEGRVVCGCVCEGTVAGEAAWCVCEGKAGWRGRGASGNKGQRSGELARGAGDVMQSARVGGVLARKHGS